MRAWDRRSRRIAAKTAADRTADPSNRVRSPKRHNPETGFRFQTAGRAPANGESVMLIRVLFVVLFAFPLAVVAGVATAFAEEAERSKRNGTRFKLAGSRQRHINRAERPAPQRDLRDHHCRTRIKVRSFRTKLETDCDANGAGGDTTISLPHRTQRALVPTISLARSPETMSRRHFGQLYPSAAGAKSYCGPT